jgi:HEAT repeat protein
MSVNSSLPALAEALKDKDPRVRAKAAFAIGLHDHEKSERYAGALIACLRDENADVRERAAFALGDIGTGPEAKAAIPFLLAARTDPEAKVRATVLGTLGGIAPSDPEVAKALLAALNDPDPKCRFAAVECVDESDPRSLKALIGALADASEIVRKISARKLAKAGRSAKEALPVLHTRLKLEPKKDVRIELENAVKTISGEDGPP